MKIQSPPVGMPVQFFPGGIRDVYRQPWSGRVVESGQDGCVKIVCDVPGGGSVGNQEFHRWMGDTEWIKQNTQFLAKAYGTMPRGCWDYVPGLEPRARIAWGEVAANKGLGEFVSDTHNITGVEVLDGQIVLKSENQGNDETDSKPDRRQRGESMVIKLLADGKDLDDIAKAVRSYGLSKSDVEQIVSEAEVTA